MSIEVLVKVLMDERSEWAKVRDELRVMLTTMFTFTTVAPPPRMQVNEMHSIRRKKSNVGS